jgi:hypothetical protein
MDFLSSGSSRHGDEPPVQQEYTQHEWDEWKSHKGWQALDARPHCVSDGKHMDDVEPRYATVEDQLADVPEDVVSFLNDMDAINAEFEMWPRAPEGYGRIRNTSPPVPQPCEPTPYVLLGDLDDLTIEVMRQHKVGTVISMCPEKMESSNTIIGQLQHENVQCYSVPALDTDSYDILPIVEEYGGIISKSVNAGTKTFIHCWGGINRAPALVLGYMVLIKGEPIIDAFTRIVNARGEVLTNKVFRRQIITEALRRENSITV